MPMRFILHFFSNKLLKLSYKNELPQLFCFAWTCFKRTACLDYSRVRMTDIAALTARLLMTAAMLFECHYLTAQKRKS